MKSIGEDVAEKLDDELSVFAVERHLHGKWLLAEVPVAKYLDRLPLYWQEAIFERAGIDIARPALAQWVVECGVRLQVRGQASCCDHEPRSLGPAQ